MSVTAKVLNRLAAIGAKVETVDNRLVLRAGPCAVPAALVAELVSLKPELLRLLATAASATSHDQNATTQKAQAATTIWDAGYWHGLYHQLVAVRQCHFGYPRAEAEHLAWGEIETRWHMQHGRRAAVWQCAGCRKPIGGQPTLKLADGTGVHLDGLDCVISYGNHWRRAATRALLAIGLRPPPRRS